MQVLWLRAGFFLAGAILFGAVLFVLHTWGGSWARGAYRPILMQRVDEARARGAFGEAEAHLLRALRVSPAYAPDIFAGVRLDLCVMPELAQRLRQLAPSLEEPHVLHAEAGRDSALFAAPMAHPSNTANPE